MAYTTIDKSSDYFETVLYTGNGGTNSISSLDFQPDWLWIKCRSDANGSNIFDVLRGTNSLHSDTNGPDADRASDGFTSLDNDGFTLSGDGSGGSINVNSRTYAAWSWKAGTSFSNDASSTSVGSIDSTGSVSTDAGFSIINVVKNNTTAHTVAHGLGAVPQMIIGKSRTGNAYRWIVYHQAIGNTDAQYLNENFANTDSATFWNDTSPTSSVFTIGSDNSWNGTNIFYCFAEKQGYSKFGSYTGNGNADGTFIYTGFKPAFVMIKKTTGTDGWWQIEDNKRSPENVAIKAIFANVSDAEYSGANYATDYLSNGFKIRNSTAGSNTSGQLYIYMAFAENPFTSSAGTPVTAR